MDTKRLTITKNKKLNKIGIRFISSSNGPSSNPNSDNDDDNNNSSSPGNVGNNNLASSGDERYSSNSEMGTVDRVINGNPSNMSDRELRDAIAETHYHILDSDAPEDRETQHEWEIRNAELRQELSNRIAQNSLSPSDAGAHTTRNMNLSYILEGNQVGPQPDPNRPYSNTFKRPEPSGLNSNLPDTNLDNLRNNLPDTSLGKRKSDDSENEAKPPVTKRYKNDDDGNNGSGGAGGAGGGLGFSGPSSNTGWAGPSSSNRNIELGFSGYLVISLNSFLDILSEILSNLPS